MCHPNRSKCVIPTVADVSVAEVTRVPPLLQLLRPDAGYKGPPFASTVTTRSRRRLEDLDGCKPARGCTW